MSVQLRERPMVRGRDAKRFVNQSIMNEKNLASKVEMAVKTLERKGIDIRNVKSFSQIN